MTKQTVINKTNLHPRNLHNNGYDFTLLCNALPELKPLLITNKYNNQLTIDFSDSNSVKALNHALLKFHYHIKSWNIPEQNLCPAIPGRVDYIHYLQDLLSSTNLPSAFKDKSIVVLDVGTGASCIYPLLGHQVYGWHFIASDIDSNSINNAKSILQCNVPLVDYIDCRLQSDQKKIFNGVIKQDEIIHMTLCNPPFHKSLKEANQGSQNKWQNLAKSNTTANKQSKGSTKLNFSGQKAELWCEGGELAFIRNMIKESKQFKTQVYWFTCLISQKDNLFLIKQAIKKANANQVKVIKMAQGNKTSRFIAWSYVHSTL